MKLEHNRPVRCTTWTLEAETHSHDTVQTAILICGLGNICFLVFSQVVENRLRVEGYQGRHTILVHPLVGVIANVTCDVGEQHKQYRWVW